MMFSKKNEVSGSKRIIHNVSLIVVATFLSSYMVTIVSDSEVGAASLPAVGSNPAISTGFEIDGNKARSAALPAAYDWNDLFGGNPKTGSYTTSQGFASTGILDARFLYDNGTEAAACGKTSEATTFIGGQKVNDATWTIIPGSTNSKSDICTIASAYEIVDVVQSGVHTPNIIYYSYWTRLSGRGNMSTYELLAGPQSGRCDDVLIQFDYTSEHGGSMSFKVLKWNGGCNVGDTGSWVNTGTAVSAVGRVGINTDVAVSSGDPETFGEYAINLTQSGILPSSGACATLNTGGVASRTGSSSSAALIDAVQYTSPMPIGNCGSVSVEKKTNLQVESSDFFGYSISKTDRSELYNAGTLSGGTNTSLATNLIASTTQIGQVTTWEPLFMGLNYQVTETSAPSAWRQQRVACTYKDIFHNGQETSVVLYENGAATGRSFPIFPAETGSGTSCTITNTTSGVTISKTAQGDQSQPFQFQVNGTPLTVPAGGTSAFLPFSPGQEVTITENPSNVIPHWDFTSAVCDDSSATRGAEGSVTVTTVEDRNIHCVFTNTQRGTITIAKKIDGGDTASHFTGTWAGIPEGGFSLMTINGFASTTFENVLPGTYTVDEALPDMPYRFSGLSCVDSTSGQQASSSAGSTGTIRLDPGEHVTCTYTNVELAQVSVAKTTDPDRYPERFTFHFGLDGQPKTDFSLSPTDTPWGSGYIVPGTYTLTEDPLLDWSLAEMECGPAGSFQEGVMTLNVTPGANIICTVHNQAIKAKASITKQIANVAQGYAWSFDFTLQSANSQFLNTQSATDQNPRISWQDLQIGTIYTLQESTVDYWNLGVITCGDLRDADDQLGGFQFLATPGLVVDCYVTNVASSAHITLDKHVAGVPEGYAWSFDVTLSPDVTGPATQQVDTRSSTVAWSDLVPGTVYTLSERGQSGWISGQISCRNLQDLDFETEGFQVLAAPGQEISCEVTNAAQPGSVHLNKIVTGDAVDVWTFDMTLSGGNSSDSLQQTVTQSSPNASWSGLGVGVTYTLREEKIAQGWVQNAFECVGLSDADPNTDGYQFVVLPGMVLDCSLLNEAISPKLTLKKQVENGTSGSTITSDAWTLSADGPTPIRGYSASEAVTNVSVSQGTYTLQEYGNVSGYIVSGWDCGDQNPVHDATVTLELGQDVTCTVTNVAQTPHLTLLKSVDNAHGGQATAQDWTLFAYPEGQDIPTLSGVSGSEQVTNAELSIGTYVLDERTVSAFGYEQTQLLCTRDGRLVEDVSVQNRKIQINLGENVVCGFVNRDTSAHLTLIKTVDAANSGSVHVPVEWSLNATPQSIQGQDTVSGNGDPSTPGGVNRVPIFAGKYTLDEIGPAGFDPGVWECMGGTLSNNIVTVINGANVICRIVNTAVAPRLTLVKQVENGQEGTANSSDWALHAQGPTSISGVSGNVEVTDAAVAVGTYLLSESDGPTGYASSGWECQGGGLFSNNVITLSEGQNAVCTITNVATPSEWSISKTSNPPSGTTVVPGQAIEYTLNLLHTSGVIPSSLSVHDDLSELLLYATLVGDFVASQGQVTLNENDLKWDLTHFEGSLTLTYRVTVNQNQWGVHLKNTVLLPPNILCEGSCTTDHPTPHWTVYKRSNIPIGTSIQPGTVVTYTVGAHNTSDAIVSGARVVDTMGNVFQYATLNTPLPDGLSLNPENPAQLIWDVPTILPHSPDPTIEFSVTVKPDAYNAHLVNVITPISETGGDCLIPNAQEQLGCNVEIDVLPLDLAIEKTHATLVNNAIEAGREKEIVYTLDVRNLGESHAHHVVVNDPLPAGLTMKPDSIDLPLGWDSSASTATTFTATFEGPFEPGAQNLLTFSAIVGDQPIDQTTGASEDISNTACVIADGDDADQTNNCSTDQVQVASMRLNAYADCAQNVPHLNYEIRAFHLEENSTVSLIWWDPADFVKRNQDIDPANVQALLQDGALMVEELHFPAGWTTGQIVSGSALWAGAQVDANGKGLAWPGWEKGVDGVWNLDASSPFYPIRDRAMVEIRNASTDSMLVEYPGSGSQCAPEAVSVPEIPKIPEIGITYVYPFQTPNRVPDIPTALAYTGSQVSIGFGVLIWLMTLLFLEGLVLTVRARIRSRKNV